ncbi:MAG: malonyl-CoA synthase [Gammaproteobacteria bacterium]
MDNQSIYRLFESRFPAARSRPFIETGQGVVYTYADLETASGRYARTLADLGVNKGDRVAVQVEKSPQALFLYLACLRAGFIYLPLNTAYLEDELDYFLGDAAPAAVVCAPAKRPMMEKLANRHAVAHVLTLDGNGGGSLNERAPDKGGSFGIVPCSADDNAVILYTSGTTGRPKGAMISHGNLAANGLALHQAWGWEPDDVLLHALPIFHIHGLFVACHCVLLNGTGMLFLPKFDATAVRRLLPRATVMMGVPTFYTRLLSEPDFGREDCRNMRLFTSGSAPLLEQTFEEFKQRTGHTILERYGMTETGMNTSNPLQGERLAGTVGLPLPGVSVRVTDDDDQPVADGTVGQLQVKGDNVFKGYWRLPDKTAEEFTADGWFRTGDQARRDTNGYLSIVGRSKDMVITGGYNVYPKEVESVIDALDGVVESAVIGLPHADFGEMVAAVVVRDAGGASLDEARIISTLKTRLAGYKVPKRIFFADSLPRNTMGKVQKNLLRRQYADQP